MSDKIAKDELIQLHQKKVLNPSTFFFSEQVFSAGAVMLSWKDIQQSRYVCKGWAKYLSGPFLLTNDCRKRFYETFPGEDDVC
jgi:hypothetical protein